jgi:multiple sugar transport system permease protein
VTASVNQSKPKRQGRRITIQGIFGRLLLLLFMLFWLFPLYWLINTTFKFKAQIQSFAPVWFPNPPTMTNITWVLENLERGPLQRSIIAVVVSVGIALLIGPPMAYMLSRIKGRASRELQFWIISTRMLPPAALIMPYYFLLLRVNLHNTETGLILIYTAINLPLVVWIMLAYLRSLPPDVEEAALIDGCGRWGAFRHVVLPATLSSVAAAGLITTILTWNEFFIAFIVTSSNITFPVQVSTFLATGMNPEYGNMAAAGLLLSIPPAILAIVFRRALVSGLHAFAGGK